MSRVTKGLGLKFDLPPSDAPPPAPAAEPVTGVMRNYSLVQQTQELRAQVQRLEGERGAQPLDPKLIRPSRWANRHLSSFASPEFWALRAEIESAGGNVQPVKVRPLHEPDSNGARYELVFGHRRHRACLELGLPVLAVVAELDDRALFAEMDRENRARANLSAYEQGAMYRRALDEGLFPSLRKLAEAIGASAGTISKAISITELPDAVVRAFPSPGTISFAWAADLRAALERNAEAVLAAAEAMPPGAGPREVLARLLDAAVSSGNTPSPVPTVSSGNAPPRRLDLGRGRHVEVRTKGEKVTLELDAALLSAGSWEALQKALKKIVGA